MLSENLSLLEKIAVIVTIATPLYGLGLLIYRLLLRSKSIFKWRDINRGIVELSEKIKNTWDKPNIIIGNGVIINLLDDLFLGSEAIKLVEIDKESYAANKESVDQNFIVVQSQMWYHLIPKQTLELYAGKKSNCKVLIFVNYVQSGEVYKNIKMALDDIFPEENVKVATLFKVKDFDRGYLQKTSQSGGHQVNVDFYWKTIKSFSNTYLPWGNVSKSKRRYDFEVNGQAYMAYKRKLIYYYREHIFKRKEG